MDMRKDMNEFLGNICKLQTCNRDDEPDTMLDDDYDGYPNDESNLRGGHLPYPEDDPREDR